MNAIPTDILIPWIRECYRFTGIDESESERFYAADVDWGMVSLGLVSWWVDVIERRHLEKQSKQVFTEILQKHIRNHDNI